jgi:hypothetical protein
MEINFFEEFPTSDNLEKIKLIDFPTKIYILAHSLSEFREFEKSLKVPLVYWPALPKIYGYWVSPFAKRGALLKVLSEVKNEPIELMLDLEPPMIAPWMYLIGLPNFWRNKKFIASFIEESKPEITLVELHGNKRRLKFWGLHYESERVNMSKMVYTSLFKGPRGAKLTKLRRACELGVKKYGAKFKIGLGCIAGGILGNEPILLPEELKEDLQIVKENKVPEAIIFRLGGLNEAYIEIIRKFI